MFPTTAWTATLTNGRRNKAAIIWQGEPEEDTRVYTYQMLHTEVCRFANVLKKKGVKRGDRVSLYMPMIPELAIAMLACTRLGALHSIVFAGFSSIALQSRIEDAEAKVLITADAVLRAGKTIPLKPNADEALKDCPSVEQCIVVRRGGKRGRDGRGPATPGGTTRSTPTTSPRTAVTRKWTPRIRCSSSTPPAPPASPRACCTPRAAT